MAGLLFTTREGSAVASSPAPYAGSGRHGIRVAAATICHRGHRSGGGEAASGGWTKRGAAFSEAFSHSKLLSTKNEPPENS